MKKNIKSGILLLQFLAFLPLLSFFTVLYVQRKDNTYLYMLVATLLTFLLVRILDELLEKYAASEIFKKNFCRIEFSEVTEELEKNKKELEHSKKVGEDYKRKNEQLSFEKIEAKALHEGTMTGYVETVMTLVELMEENNKFERGHCRRVMEIACEVGRRVGLREDEIEILRFSALLHDIGKKDYNYITNKTTDTLSDEEKKKLKEHPIIVFTILENIVFLKTSAEVIAQHHERFDGIDNRLGLSGEQINIMARILCLADAFEAMVSDRPHRKGMSMNFAINEIRSNKGTQFDPEIAEILIGMVEENETGFLLLNDDYDKKAKENYLLSGANNGKTGNW